MSYVHPFGFDWFKPELVLIHTPFGVDKIHFASLLAAILLAEISLRNRWAKQKAPTRRAGRSGTLVPGLLSLLLFILALDPTRTTTLSEDPEGKIALGGTRVPVEEKWKARNFDSQFSTVLQKIDRAIDQNRSAILLPESVLPIFLNRSPAILEKLLERSRKIHIVLGALYDTDGQNRNSAYHLHDGKYRVADKIVLVPFGEANPLPSWAGKIVNRIFFDGAPDYEPASHPTDFVIGKKKYRAAVCYEGTSERLYRDRPQRILLISNNGWFVPSAEATLQRLLLEYYSRKYGTTIYHTVNMGPSYVVVRSEE